MKPIRTLTASAAAVLATSAILSAPASAQMWQEAIGTGEEERSEWTWATADGGFAMSGFRWPGSAWAAKMDSNGNLLWDNIYTIPGQIDVFHRIQETSDGGYICAGETSAGGTSGYGISLVKLDAGGNLMWSRVYPGTPFAGGSPGGVAVDETADRGFIIAGRIQLAPGADQAGILIRTTPTGAPLWERYYIDTRYGPNTFASFFDVHALVSSDGTNGGFIVSGYTSPSVNGDRDSHLMRTDDSGNVLWSKTYGHTGFYDWGSGCDPASNGDFLMTGFAKAAGEGGGTYLMRTDPAGNLLWHETWRLFAGTSSMEETPSGDIVLAGNALDFVGFQQPAILETNSIGTINWCMAYGNTTQEFGESVVPAQGGGYHLLGWARPLAFGDFDVYSVRTDSNGVSGCDEVAWTPMLVPLVPPVIDVQMEVRDIQGFEVLPLEQFDAGNLVELLCDPTTGDCVEPPSCMTAWWPLDDIASSTATEELIHGNNGTPNAAVTPLAGEYVDSAACFDGTSAEIIVLDDPAIDLGADDFSIDFWIRPVTNMGGVESILDKRAGSLGYHVYFYQNQIGLRMAGGSPTNWTATTPLTLNEWTFVAITVDRDDPTGGKVYLDGALVYTFNPTSNPGSLDTSAPLSIGNRSAGFSNAFFEGCLDEIELFNRVLDPSEVAMLFDADTFGKCKDLCLSDLDGDGQVGFGDLIAMLSSWGSCPDACCDADINGDGSIGFGDLIAMLSAWGPCS